MFAAICTKHLGFAEEKEWRIVHIPKVYPSELLKGSVEMIGSVPQLVYKIPLQNMPAAGLTGIEIPDLLDRIIIWPTDFPVAMRDAFAELLYAAGVANPKSRIEVSGIPLRN